MRSEETVRKALEQHKSLREVVLDGAGRTRLGGLRDLPHDPQRQARDPGRHRLRLGLHHRLPGRRRADHLAQRTLGFHRASFPGMDDDDMHESNRGIRNFLVYSARLTPSSPAR